MYDNSYLKISNSKDAERRPLHRWNNKRADEFVSFGFLFVQSRGASTRI